MPLKPGGRGFGGVGIEGSEAGLADRVLRVAREAAGLAAYHYFFQSSTEESRATYLAALEAEAEAELLLRDIRAAPSA